MVKSLSVVIPAYNEEANVVSCLRKVHSVLSSLDLDWEIILVNDGSKDRTGYLARQEAKKIPHLKIVENKPNRGYGGSLKAGFSASTKEFIAMTHADNQLDFSEIGKLIDLQNQTDADIVSGIRIHGSDPIHRQFFRWGWNTLVRALFGYLATDIDSGFKLFKRSVLDKVSLFSDGAMVDTQLLAGARVRGMKIVELPVSHHPRTAGKSTGGNPRVIFKALREMMVFWWHLKQEILVEQGRAVFRWEAIAIVCILVLAAVLRLWHIDQYMTFLGDEGRDAIVMRDIMTGSHFPLIGPGTSIGSMYLGPLYYYLIAPSLWLFHFSPVGPAVAVATISLLTISLLWWIGRQWFSRTSALLISTLYAVSPAVIIYSRSSWNPNIMPFFALLTMYGIWKVWRLGYWRWLIISGVSFALVLNSHYLGLLLLPPILIFWFLAIRKNSLNAKKCTLISSLIFLTLMSPLLFFDLRHNWQNFSALKLFFTDRQTTVNLKAYKAVPNLVPIWQDITTQLLAANVKSLGIWLSFGLVALAVLSLANKDLFFTSIWIGAAIVGLGLYKQHIYTHYFGFVFPAVFLLLGFVLDRLKSLSVIAGLILVVVFLSQNPLKHSPNKQLEHTRYTSHFISEQSAGKPFNLALITKSNYDASYRYFLSLQNAPFYTIHQQITDQLFVICEISDCQPINNPLWEIASFGWAKIDRQWELPWGVKIFRLVHNASGKNEI